MILRAAAGGPLRATYALSPAAVLGQLAPRPSPRAPRTYFQRGVWEGG